ncbi:MAG: apolipoprotein N-acyltransferase [Actinomycetes bacterium]
MSRLKNLVLAVVAGLMLSAAFPDIGAWFLAPVAIGVLFIAVSQSRARGAFGLGFVFGMAFFLVHVSWIKFAVGPVPWVALCAACAAYFGLACAVFAHANWAGFFDGRPWLTVPVFAVAWVAAETVRSFGPFGGFPWGRLAFAVVDAPVVNLAKLGGAPLVSLAVAVTGGFLGLAWMALREKRALTAVGAPVLALAIMLAPLGVPLDERPEVGTLRVGWAQGNVPNEGLDSLQQARLVTQNHTAATLQLAQEAAAPLDLTVWPENSVDIDPRIDEPTRSQLNLAAQAVGTPLLIGTVDYSPPGGRYNTSLIWLPSGEPAGEYRKQQPAAFAEYIPIRSIARLFSPAVDRVTSDMLPGDEPAFIDVDIASLGRAVRVGTIICFEVAYDWIARQSASHEAEFLAVQTNNATFGMTAESTQQLAMTRLRAIETGKAALQVSTVGVSGVVTPAGRLIDRSELFTQAWGETEIPLRTSVTPAVRYGAFLEWGVVAIAALTLIGAVRVRLDERYEW